MKERVQGSHQRLEVIANRQHLKANSKPLGEVACVILRSLGGITTRHANPRYVIRAQRFHRDRRNKRGINAAAEANEGFRETALAHVIPGAENKGIPRSFDFKVIACGKNLLVARYLESDLFGSDRAAISGCVEDHEVFSKRRGLRHDSAIRPYGQRASVEDETVIAADLIGHGHKGLVAFRKGT